MGDDLLADAQTHSLPRNRRPAAAVSSTAIAALDATAFSYPLAHLDAFADGELEEGGTELWAVCSVQERVDCGVAPSWMNKDFFTFY